MSFREDPANRKAILSIDNIKKASKRSIRQGFYKVGKLLKASANTDILAKNKTGIVYKIRRGKVTRRHQASAKGETFANLSGAARRTLGFAVKGASELEFGFRKNQKTFYTKILETSLSRPALGNAVRKEQGTAISIMEQEIEKELR
jgi:hypothetical protein